MARSSFIWLVERDHMPWAAFTVKHELVTWLTNQKYPNSFHVYKLSDGPVLGKPSSVTYITIESLLHGVYDG